MGMMRRAFIVLATIGWLVPLCVSYWASHDFLWNHVWPAAALGQPSMRPWHPFDVADELFYFSIAWLATVLIGWSINLTATRHRG